MTNTRFRTVKIKLIIIEPWSFPTENGTEHFDAEIIAEKETQNGCNYLIKFNKQQKYNGLPCKYLFGEISLNNAATPTL